MRAIISAGGTGGHIYPALAIIDKLKEIENAEILYIGTHNRMEKDIIPKEGIKYEKLEIYGFSRTNPFRNFKNIFLIMKAQRKCKRIMTDFKPDIVIGVGGYVTYPVIKSAYKLGIKTFLHEQNSIPGKTNQVLAKYADVVGVSFAESIDYFNKITKVEVTGNPCGERALQIKAISKKDLGLTPNKKLLVIVSGSLGSKTVNTKMKGYLLNIGYEKYEVLYITGKNHYEEFIKDKIFPDNVKIFPYFDNLASLLKKTDLLVTRSGASTISEILALEIPAIFIPSPYVSNNHQYYNALEIKNAGAGLIINEDELTAEILKTKVNRLLYDKSKYEEIKTNLKKIGIKNSGDKIIRIIEELVK